MQTRGVDSASSQSKRCSPRSRSQACSSRPCNVYPDADDGGSLVRFDTALANELSSSLVERIRCFAVVRADQLTARVSL